jgi:small nuclear ribonucleoprotein (snRNP)-like protein
MFNFLAYDQHMNLVLSNVNEEITIFKNEDFKSENVEKRRKNYEMLFVRGKDKNGNLSIR